jgi:hypothetical protein
MKFEPIFFFWFCYCLKDCREFCGCYLIHIWMFLTRITEVGNYCFLLQWNFIGCSGSSLIALLYAFTVLRNIHPTSEVSSCPKLCGSLLACAKIKLPLCRWSIHRWQGHTQTSVPIYREAAGTE